METKLRAARGDVLLPLDLSYTEARIWESPAVKFAPDLIECVRIGAQKAGLSTRDMISGGAGHDACYVARGADNHDLCALRRRHLAQRSGMDQPRTMRRRRLGAAQRRLEYDRRLG